MNFTNTDCVEYDICWQVENHVENQLDDQVSLQVWNQVDDELRLDLIEQMESQVSEQVYVHHNPIKNKIKQEIKK